MRLDFYSLLGQYSKRLDYLIEKKDLLNFGLELQNLLSLTEKHFSVQKQDALSGLSIDKFLNTIDKANKEYIKKIKEFEVTKSGIIIDDGYSKSEFPLIDVNSLCSHFLKNKEDRRKYLVLALFCDQKIYFEIQLFFALSQKFG